MKNLYPCSQINFRSPFLLFFSLLLSIQTWGQLSCSDFVQVSLDDDCLVTIDADFILEGGPYCYPCMLVELDKTPGAPDCNGPWLLNTVDANDIGKTYCVRVTNPANGNFCQGFIQIVDNIPPILTCPNNTTVGMDATTCYHTAANGEFDPSVTENCTTPTLMYTLFPLTFGNSGSGNNTLNGVAFNYLQTQVRWTATDASGNSSTCTFTIQVNDLQPPQIACPGNLTLNTDPGQCTYTIQNTELDPSSWSENCPLGLAWGLSGANNDGGNNTMAGYVMQAGLTNVSWVVVENYSGNIVFCSFDVQINDNEAPSISCPNAQQRDADPSQCTYTTLGAEFDATGLNDNCPGLGQPQYTLSTGGNGSGSLAGQVFPKGPTTITWTVTDAAGNPASCSFNVIVKDNEAPTITCPADQTRTLVSGCAYTTLAGEFNPSAWGDNCPGPTLAYVLSGATIGNGPNTLAGVVFQFGLTTVTWTVTDGNGATTSCSFMVSISTTAVEICNNLDDDCDGIIDEGVKLTFYADTDGDGYGDVNSTTLACTAPPGFVSDQTDCDDSDALIHPNAIEICNNSIDDDCDGFVDESRHPDYDALIALYNATNGPAWYNRSGWASGALGVNCNVCTWYGVYCNQAGRVLELYMPSNNLNGNIPPEIGDLGNLQYLDLPFNQLTGSLPPEIGNLGNLQDVNLTGNQLTGCIPPEIGNLGNLQNLSLPGNQLTCSIPPEIGNLGNLKYLYLSNNQLMGSIPPEIGNLGNLKDLRLSVNQLTGSIPSEIGNLGNLNSLDLYNNQLSGCFPLTLSGFCNNASVSLGNNPGLPGGGAWYAFCQYGIGGDADGDGYCKGPGAGTDCDDTNSAINPGVMELCGNNIDDNCNGFIDEANSHPDFAALMDLYNSTDGPNWTNNTGWGTDCNVCGWYGVQCYIPNRVTDLSLDNNNLVGTLPSTIGSLTNLIHLYLSDNTLSGPIPSSIVNLTNLHTLHIGNNLLSSSIPSNIGNLTNLEGLLLGGNQLSGPIPVSIGNLPILQILSLDFNQLSGPIPPSIGYLPNLHVLYLANNQLSGCLPGTMSNLCNGTQIDLSNNPSLPGGGSPIAWAAFCSASHTGGDFDGDSYCNGLGLGDCNDADPAIHPGAPELCNGLDDNCNGQTDENIISNFTASVVVSCSNPGGNKIVVSNVLGGTPPFKYGLNGSFQNVPTFSNLSAGTYQVTVKEANGPGCPFNKTVVVNPLMTLTTSSTNVSCNGAASGSVSVVVSGGTPNYTYVWRRGSTIVGNNATATGLIAGNYRVTVRDNNGTGCTKVSGIVTISQPPTLNLIKTTHINVACNGGTNGKLTVIGNSGTPPYSYSWGSFGTNPSISGLSAGTYTCTLSDANGCTKVATYTITQPSLLTLGVVSVLPWTGGLKKVTVAASGGSPSYKYRVVPPGGNFLTPSIFYLAAGSYVFEARDNKGCIASLSYQVSFAGPLDERTDIELVAEDVYAGSSGIVIFPNPSEGSGFVSVLLRNIETERAEFLLHDALGREVLRQTLPIQTDDPVRLPIQQIPSGVYHLAVITDNGKVYLEKLIIGSK